jgi:hypothetical protein
MTFLLTCSAGVGEYSIVTRIDTDRKVIYDAQTKLLVIEGVATIDLDGSGLEFERLERIDG